MKLFVILLLFIILSSCMQKEIEGEVTHELDSILYQFNSDIGKLGYTPFDFSMLVIKRADLSKDVRFGYCNGIQLDPKYPAVIQIDNSVFGIYRTLKTEVLYHELGHCFLGLGHVDSLGIMFSGDLRKVDISDESVRMRLLKNMMESSIHR